MARDEQQVSVLGKETKKKKKKREISIEKEKNWHGTEASHL